MWYILISGIQLFLQMFQYWNVPGAPEHSFDVLGPGVLLTVFFPLFWVIIFAFCREIASKNKIIADLEAKQKTGDLQERKTTEGSSP